jgi:probable rRNA maturation factor
MSLNIIFFNKQRKFNINLNSCKNIINQFFEDKVFSKKNFHFDMEIILYVSFVSSKNIRLLKNKIFNLDIVTDVISLPMDTDLDNMDIQENFSPIIFGEIFICPEQADRQCLNFENDFDAEIKLLLIHGLLHLIGFDDISPEDEKIMRLEEKKMLKLIEK